MTDVYNYFLEAYPQVKLLLQEGDMDENERDEFLEAFIEEPEESLVAFVVLGGIFSEGIDLKGDRLIGTAIVGVGLPQLCLERNIIKDYFNEEGQNGYHYAYTYPGMNKVMQAAHSYGGRRTERNEVMYGQEGHIYVYFIYGMHYCFNVITEKENVPRGVLVRAIEPIRGMELMALNRYKKNFSDLTKREIKNLTNGPAKLCAAFGITREHNGMDICQDDFYIAEDEESRADFEIVRTTRINIDYSEEARFYPWRFYIKDNPYVSKK
jgi:DNA-3-methyladenine glycosylase